MIARSWQVVGDLAQLADPGDCHVGDVAGEPVIVVRDKDGEIHSFYNVCRHRGGPLALKDSNIAMLKCLYHGWTNRLDGMLRGCHTGTGSSYSTRQDYGLVPVRHGLGGQVFVSLDPSQPIETSFAGIRERVAPMQLSLAQVRAAGGLRGALQLESVRGQLPRRVSRPARPSRAGETLRLPVYRTESLPTYSLQHSPLAEGTGEALYYQVFPNYMLNILPNRLQTNLVVPVAPDRCKVIFRYYYADVDSAGARRKIEDDLAYSDKVRRKTSRSASGCNRAFNPAPMTGDASRFSSKTRSITSRSCSRNRTKPGKTAPDRAAPRARPPRRHYDQRGDDDRIRDLIVPATVLANVHTTGLSILAWIVGGIVSLLGALSVASFPPQCRMPAGSMRTIQRAYGPLWGFLYGWSGFAVINSASIAAIAVGFATYAGFFVHLGPLGIQLVAIGSIAVLTLINALGVRLGANVQNALTLIKIATLAAIVVAAFFLGPARPPTSSRSTAPRRCVRSPDPSASRWWPSSGPMTGGSRSPTWAAR